ncbi:unnamed protein product [Rhizophagus irregularis]|nr:unnamed protein product [Rhizophagus irregularis]CAB5373008.1 unnamed protein product [Rhizophagus irregularis]
MTESVKSEKSESSDINIETKDKKSELNESIIDKIKKIEIKLGKIFHRPHKKLPRSVKPPSQSPFFPNLAFLTNIQTNQYNQKVSDNYSNFKNEVDTAAANANSSGTGVQNLQYSQP